jgi:hypothetical protein
MYTLFWRLALSSSSGRRIGYLLCGVCLKKLFIIKSSIFWDIMPRSSLKVSQHFEEHVASFSCFMLAFCLSYSLTLKMEAVCSLKCQLTFNRVCSIISQKIEIFMPSLGEPQFLLIHHRSREECVYKKGLQISVGDS